MQAINPEPSGSTLLGIAPTAPPASVASRPAAEAARATARRLEWRGVAFVVGLFVALRLYLSVVGAISFAVIPPEWANIPDYMHRGFEPMRAGIEATLLGVWVRFDANWYLEIARDGYQAGNGTVVFPPLLPALSWLVGQALGGSPLRGSLFVANVACLAAMLLFYRLARLDLGEAGARRGLLWLMLFPASFYFFIPYTESLYLALAVGAFLAARTGRWPVAIGLGMLAATTRVPGAFLAGPLCLELMDEPARRWLRERRLPGGELAALVRRALPLTLIPAALGLYAAYAYLIVGDHLLWRHLEEFWGLHWAPPWAGLIGDARFLLDPPILEGTTPVPWINEGTNRTGPLIDLIAGVLFLALAVIGLWRQRPSYSLYTWLLLLSGLTKLDNLDLTQSLTRYVLVIFPAFILLGSVRLPRPLSLLLLTAGTLLLGLLVAWFVHWFWLW